MSTHRWEITPYVGIGPLRLGMSRREVEAALDGPGRMFVKSFDPLTEAYAYNDHGAHIYYDKNGAVEFIETFEPCIATFCNVILAGRLVEDVRADLEKIGVQCDSYDCGFRAFGVGFGVYAPTDEDDIEGVGIFVRGHFES